MKNKTFFLIVLFLALIILSALVMLILTNSVVSNNSYNSNSENSGIVYSSQNSQNYAYTADEGVKSSGCGCGK